jgi:hypothetical protein
VRELGSCALSAPAEKAETDASMAGTAPEGVAGGIIGIIRAPDVESAIAAGDRGEHNIRPVGQKRLSARPH